MVGHAGSSAGSYLADPTCPIPSHCAVIILFKCPSASTVVTSTVRVKRMDKQTVSMLPKEKEHFKKSSRECLCFEKDSDLMYMKFGQITALKPSVVACSCPWNLGHMSKSKHWWRWRQRRQSFQDLPQF